VKVTAPAERGLRVVVRRASDPVRLMHNAGEPGRHVHIMADDVHIAVRVEPARVRRDPLVAALFGPGPGRAPVVSLPPR
jgi:hypothetical protein